MNKVPAKPGGVVAKARPQLNRIVGKSLIPHLLCGRTAGSGPVYLIELTAEQFSDPRVAHGHGAENAGETKR
jgi:hypothetical protein